MAQATWRAARYHFFMNTHRQTTEWCIISLIVPTIIPCCQLHELDSPSLKWPAATSYDHLDGRQSGCREGVDHSHVWPSGRQAIAAPDRRPRPCRVTRSCPCMSSVGSVRGIQRGRCMGGGRSHCRRRPGLPSSSSSYFGFIPRIEIRRNKYG